MSKDTLHFILTGGTIDSCYDPVKATALPIEHSYIPQFIPILKLYETVTYTEIFMKDSRSITETDRKKICNTVANSKSQRVIITHGSYTVVKTAQYLQKHLVHNNKVIIFVCSLIPLMGFAPTDAGFNLG